MAPGRPALAVENGQQVVCQLVPSFAAGVLAGVVLAREVDELLQVVLGVLVHGSCRG